MKKYDDILTQKEIGLSSWFGLVWLLNGSSKKQKRFIQNLNKEALN